MNYEDLPEPSKDEQDYNAYENHVLDLEEAIAELEDHLVHDHECARPSVVERVHYRDGRPGQ